MYDISSLPSKISLHTKIPPLPENPPTCSKFEYKQKITEANQELKLNAEKIKKLRDEKIEDEVSQRRQYATWNSEQKETNQSISKLEKGLSDFNSRMDQQITDHIQKALPNLKKESVRLNKLIEKYKQNQEFLYKSGTNEEGFKNCPFTIKIKTLKSKNEEIGKQKKLLTDQFDSDMRKQVSYSKYAEKIESIKAQKHSLLKQSMEIDQIKLNCQNKRDAEKEREKHEQQQKKDDYNDKKKVKAAEYEIRKKEFENHERKIADLKIEKRQKEADAKIQQEYEDFLSNVKAIKVPKYDKKDKMIEKTGQRKVSTDIEVKEMQDSINRNTTQTIESSQNISNFRDFIKDTDNNNDEVVGTYQEKNDLKPIERPFSPVDGRNMNGARVCRTDREKSLSPQKKAMAGSEGNFDRKGFTMNI